MFMNNQIITVNGENGARAYQMLPNSSVILLDETAPLIWVKITDGAGYPKLTPYEIKEYVPPEPVNLQALLDRVAELEKRLNNEKSDNESYDEIREQCTE